MLNFFVSYYYYYYFNKKEIKNLIIERCNPRCFFFFSVFIFNKFKLQDYVCDKSVLRNLSKT